MDVDLPVVHHQALQWTGNLVCGVKADQWHDPTPCADWDVRELLNHIVSGNRWVKPLVSGETIAGVGDRLDGDLLGESPHLAYEASAHEADFAFCQEGAMAAPCAVSYGPVPGSVYCGHRLIDVLIHGWDLATATHQDTTMDREVVEACLAVIEPQQAELAGSGAFGSPVPVPVDADSQTRLLGILGRRP